MKRSTLIGVFAVLMAGLVGFALGTDHTKPRVKGTRYIIHQLLKQPQAEAAFKAYDDHWEEIQKRYKNVDENDVKEEKWDSWTDGTEVRVIYDTVEEEIRISCDTPRCKKPY